MHRLGFALSCLVILSACGGSTTGSSTPNTSPSVATSSAATSASPVSAKPATSASASASASVSAGAAASKPVPSGTLVIPYSQPAAGFVPLWLAHDKGLFKKYGLTTDVRNLQPPTDIQSVVSGETPIGVDGSLGANAIASGAPITFIAVPGPIFTQSIYAAPNAGISSIGELVGKTVGATGRGGSSDNALHTLLAKEGVDASKVNIAYLRDDSTILAALTGGSIQAAILTSPNTLRAKQSGAKELVYMPPLKLRTVNNGIIARVDYAKQHPDVVENFLKAYIEGIKIARTDATTTKASIATYTKLDDQVMLEESYRTALTLWVPYPLATDDEFQNVIALATEANVKNHKPSDFYDNSYLQKLQDFVKTVYPEGVPTA